MMRADGEVLAARVIVRGKVGGIFRKREFMDAEATALWEEWDGAAPPGYTIYNFNSEQELQEWMDSNHGVQTFIGPRQLGRSEPPPVQVPTAVHSLTLQELVDILLAKRIIRESDLPSRFHASPVQPPTGKV